MIRKYEQFSNSVACLYRDIQKLERIEMAKYGLKGPHAQCLLCLSRYPRGLTSTQLCDMCERDKAAISRTVAELEETGLVTRVERNGTRYRALLVLTKKGKEAAAEVRDRAKVAVDHAGFGLDERDREVFCRVLTMISRNLHEICRDSLEN